MIQLRPDRVLKQIAVNQGQRLAPLRWLKELRGRHRGGNANARVPEDVLLDYNRRVFATLRPHVGDLAGKAVLEVGPGDNVCVAYAFLRAGCARVIAVERISEITIDERAARLLRGVDGLIPGDGPTFDGVARREGARYHLDPARFEIKREAFEELHLDPPVDVIYSNDAMEHFDDPAASFRAAYRQLAPGGLFINNVDLGGHNCFEDRSRPLDFLTCPDALWTLMFSHLVTTNRVRYSDLLAAARAAGFQVKHVEVLVRADPHYLAEVRPHLLPRYRALSDDDLGVLQCVVVAEKPLAVEAIPREAEPALQGVTRPQNPASLP